MPTLVCVPITVLEIDAALADANQAKLLGADLVELRIDSYFPGSEGESEDTLRLNELRRLLADCPLPVILTCRSAAEGGDYDGDEADRVSLLEKLCVNAEHPPAYLDFELASYTKSKNIRQKINLCVDHPKQERDVRTRLILSMHDFEGRPKDLMRRLSEAWAEPAASVVKFAFRARSIRDNLEIFEILREAPKPTIGLGMGEFGLMSRVLAPKFGGFLTFASLRDEAATAPGQPTIADLLGLYRFRSIRKNRNVLPNTMLYGVIGWPVAQSMSPLIHNAGFEAIDWDGVYLPLPVPDSDEAMKATMEEMCAREWLDFAGASVTMPHKARISGHAKAIQGGAFTTGIANTWIAHDNRTGGSFVTNTDVPAVIALCEHILGPLGSRSLAIIGGGSLGLSIARWFTDSEALVSLYSRNPERMQAGASMPFGSPRSVAIYHTDKLTSSVADVYINCTPVGMAGGPDPEGLSIPVHELAGKLSPDTVFFDTVYNPIETPMLRAARSYGFRTIDGVEMFVRQAAAQFELWTGKGAPVQLFDRLVREKLGSS